MPAIVAPTDALAAYRWLVAELVDGDNHDAAAAIDPILTAVGKTTDDLRRDRAARSVDVRATTHPDVVSPTRDAGLTTVAGFVPYWHLSEYRPQNLMDAPTYRTVLVPGCFADSIATASAGRGPGIRLLVGHTFARQIATTSDRTLTFWESEGGLHWSARVSSCPESVRGSVPVFRRHPPRVVDDEVRRDSSNLPPHFARGIVDR